MAQQPASYYKITRRYEPDLEGGLKSVYMKSVHVAWPFNFYLKSLRTSGETPLTQKAWVTVEWGWRRLEDRREMKEIQEIICTNLLAQMSVSYIGERNLQNI